MLNPPIHILAGEKVCIQATIPIQFLLELASKHTFKICEGDFTTSLYTNFTGIIGEASNPFAIICECSATFLSVSSPYNSWLPTTNQISFWAISIILL